MKVAFVVQRYSADISGGSEALCRQIAERLAHHVDLEVLTTCARDYTTWKNELEPGCSTLNGVKLRRFEVDFPRTPGLFSRITKAVFCPLNTPELEASWLREQGPYSSNFLRHLVREGHRYDAFVFFTYLYGLSSFGLPLVGDRSVLVPTAHDEPSIHLDSFKPIFEAPKRYIFLTPEERDFVQKKFPWNKPHSVTGLGMELSGQGVAERFRANRPEVGSAPFWLYLGRIDESKGCHELFDHFLHYKRDNPGPSKLVLIGQAVIGVPHHPDIISLGFVEEQEKLDALAACRALLMPSPFESLSMVLLEAWAQGRPVLANRRCEVLKGQCERSQGGFVYGNYSEFSRALREFSKSEDLANEMGAKGRDFVKKNYQWESVIATYLENIRAVARSVTGSKIEDQGRDVALS